MAHQTAIESTKSLLGSLGFSLTTKIGIEQFFPMEHEIYTTCIHYVGTVLGGVSIWLITDFIKRRREKNN